MPTYGTTFKVRGKGEFPDDMLRYDHCYPRTQDDVVVLHPHYTNIEARQSIRVVGLASIYYMKNWKPTSERWRTFGWEVLKDSISTIKID